MLSDITAAFSDLVHAVSWMDAETKRATLDKAAAVRAFIGYPEWLLEKGELARFYEGVRMDSDQFLWNMLNMKAREVKGLLGALAPKDKKEKDKDKDRWATDPIEVNAFYSRAINSIGEPSACWVCMQPLTPPYSASVPSAQPFQPVFSRSRSTISV